jgi:tryptophan synthase alpha subunit
VSTYGNLALRDGPDRFGAALGATGVTGLIVPDLWRGPVQGRGEGVLARQSDMD